MVGALPGVVPPISTSKFEVLAKLTLPLLRMPGLVPGATCPPFCTVMTPVVPVPPRVAPLAMVTGPRMSRPEPVKNVPRPSVVVPEPAFRSPAPIVTLPDSVRLIPALPVVEATSVVAASRKKFDVVAMPPEPAMSVTSSAVRSVPTFPKLVIAPVPEVVSVTSPPLPASNENVLKAMLLPLPVVRLMFVFVA